MNRTPTASDPLLEIRDLEVTFTTGRRRVEAVRGMSFHVGQGEFLAVVGRSGSGKSVTLFSVVGLVNDPPGIVAGEIRFRGASLVPPVTRYVKRAGDAVAKNARAFDAAHRRLLAEVRGRDIGLILQDPYGALVPQVSVRDQMVENLRRNRPEWRDRDLQKISADWLRRVGFGDPEAVLRRYPGELSGGMSQRAMIALVLSTEPSLLLADEPTSALDATVQLEVLELMAKLNREQGVAVLLVTHDIGVALRYASRIVVAAQGKVVDEGTREHFLRPRTELSSEASALLAGERALRTGGAPA